MIDAILWTAFGFASALCLPVVWWGLVATSSISGFSHGMESVKNQPHTLQNPERREAI